MRFSIKPAKVPPGIACNAKDKKAGKLKTRRKPVLGSESLGLANSFLVVIWARPRDPLVSQVAPPYTPPNIPSDSEPRQSNQKVSEAPKCLPLAPFNQPCSLNKSSKRGWLLPMGIMVAISSSFSEAKLGIFFISNSP